MPPKKKSIAGVNRPKQRSSITIEAKLEILRRVDEKVLSVPQLAKELQLPASTIYTIIAGRSKIHDATVTGGNQKKRLRVRKGKWDTLEAKLVDWLRQARSLKISVSGPVLAMKAKQFSLQLNLQDFKASNGWLTNFRKRHGVLFSKLHGESADVLEETVQAWQENILPGKVAGYEARNIFNADETGLYFNVLPDKSLTLSKQDTHGGKGSKARLTVLLCANADGSEKLAPLVIGKSKTPRCFQGIRSLPCPYTNQRAAWMTTAIFIDWLKKIDGKMRVERRKILLFIDNCPAHPTDLQFLTNVKVEFFPKNCTSRLQPLDQGVIHNFKYQYRKRIILRLINFVGREEVVPKKVLLLNVLQALHFLQWAWDQVTPETVANCFRHAGFGRVAAVREPQPAPPARAQRASQRSLRTAQRQHNEARHEEEEAEEDEPEDVVVEVDEETSAAGEQDVEMGEAAANDEGANDEAAGEQKDADDEAAQEDEDGEEIVVFEVEEEFTENWTIVTQYLQAEGATIEEFLFFDDDALVCQPFSDKDLLADSVPPQETAEAENDEDEEADAAEGEEPEPVSQAEGLNALCKVRAFIGQLPDAVDSGAFSLISKLETLAIQYSSKAKKQSKISDFFRRSI